MNALTEMAPAGAKPHLTTATPIVIKVAEGIDKLIPVVIDLYQRLIAFYNSISHHRPDLLAPFFIGIVMCFFGGLFWAMFIVCVLVYYIGVDA